ncbi:hypothetical protein IT570_05235 [Candidatus Sumerlaeota bacterium]|nr:hypothetical protein [Candidatus Sumerlaeota bacterium]
MRTALFLFLLIPALLQAKSEWITIEMVCPVDGAKCQLLGPKGPPEPVLTQAGRFDALEEPFSDSNAWYQCQSCGFASYMKDFRRMEPEIAKQALGVAATLEKPDAERSYNMIKFSDRLERAQRFFPVLGKAGDPEFLADFYRLEGYAYARDNNVEKAGEARRQAKLITTALAKDSAKAGLLREHLWELAALEYHLGDPAAALEHLEKADKIRYNNPKWKQAENDERNKDLAAMIIELQHRIQTEQKDAADKAAVKSP